MFWHSPNRSHHVQSCKGRPGETLNSGRHSLSAVSLSALRPRAREWLSSAHGQTALTLRVLRKKVVHVVSDAIAEIVADLAYSVQPRNQGIPAVIRQFIRNGESVLEHTYQGVEIALVVVAEVAAESDCPLAIENQQLCQARGSSIAFLYWLMACLALATDVS